VGDAAFYCVTGRDFFLGAVALLNSLRLVGHREPLVVLDCGMDEAQRRRLEPHATVLPAPREAPPSALKFAAPRARPTDVIAVLDADIIVTRRLDEPLAAARDGRLAAFENDRDRWFAEWADLLDLGELRRGPYLTSSALFLGSGIAEWMLPAVDERVEAVDVDRTWAGAGAEDDPLFFLDQDVVNAVARANLDPGRIDALPARLAPIPPFRGLSLRDPERLACAYADGTEPLLLHHASRKPWLVTMRSNAYSRLLTRVLTGPDVELRIEPGELAPQLRPGGLGAAARAAVDVGVGVPAFARRKLLPHRSRAWRDRA
jgi:hypothetical protein